MYIIKFDNTIQLKIFFSLINSRIGLTRDLIHEKICIPKTTIIDNIVKLRNRFVNDIPYIKKYKIYNNLVGRPKTIFYIPKQIKNMFLIINIPTIKMCE